MRHKQKFQAATVEFGLAKMVSQLSGAELFLWMSFLVFRLTITGMILPMLLDVHRRP